MNTAVRDAVAEIWEDARNREFNLLEKACGKGEAKRMFLDLGCGALGLLTEPDRLTNFHERSFGVDIDLAQLALNEQVAHRIVADSNRLPLKSGLFDLVVCRWVMEHLREPDGAFKEIGRILKPGGYCFIMTPNILNYAIALSRITTSRFHNFVRGNENTPTYYRANSVRRIKKICKQNGLQIRHVEILPYSFMYYGFSKLLFRAMKKLSFGIDKVTPVFNLKILCLVQKSLTRGS